MNSRRKQEILVIVHDAGGAEVIGAYLRAKRNKYLIRAYGAGPARRIFSRLGLPLLPIRDKRVYIAKIINRHTDAVFALLAAPGWMTDIEAKALEEAKRSGLKTIVYMDSWNNERERFMLTKRSVREMIPDEFWAGDKYAETSLRQKFPGTPVSFVRNQYFKDGITRYRKLKRTGGTATEILFVSQDGPESDALLRIVIRILAKKKGTSILRIRYHPVDKLTRYDGLLKGTGSQVRIIKSRGKDIVKDLLSARMVIGTETMAMAISTLCNIPTVSFLKKRTRPMLPFQNIKRVRTQSAIARELSQYGDQPEQ